MRLIRSSRRKTAERSRHWNSLEPAAIPQNMSGMNDTRLRSVY